MEKSTLISEMHKFQFGGKVICTDGEDGTLTHVVFDAAAKRLSAIGVKYGRFIGKTVYVPVATITEAASSGINLNISRAELEKSSSAASGGVLLDSRSSVQMASGQARGGLLLVAVHPETWELGYIVVHNLRPGQDTLLVQEYVVKLENGQIFVSVPEATLQTLQPYRSDAELQREVEDILFDLTPLHVEFTGMNVRVLDSVLYLDGNISSSLRGDIVRNQAAGVSGLLEIKNRLVGDDQLAGDLAMVLAHDPRTRNLPIGVYPRLGEVRLSGAVHTVTQKKVAEEIASTFPGVRAVVNDLQVNAKTDMLSVMSPAEGGRATDLVPGAYIRHTK
ncbi:MAG TPA: BON domain-containing protein [Ktedonobacteraceae bacterium]|nr:BON domain-containing protein [Ktedonobacteraceae bacterium]